MLLNGTLDNLKVFLMYLGGNCRWVPWKLSTERRTITKVYKRYWNVRYDINSVILKYRHFSGKSGLVSVHLSKLRLPFILKLANQSANKKTPSLIASMRFFYHRYLILVSCSYVSFGVLSMLVLLLMLPVLPTHRDLKWKKKALSPAERTDKGARDDGK